LAALSLQGGPDGPTYSATTPRHVRAARRELADRGSFTPIRVTADWWPLHAELGSASTDVERRFICLQLGRSRLAPGASGWLDPRVRPALGPSTEMRVCGESEVSGLARGPALPSRSRGYRPRRRGVAAYVPIRVAQSVGGVCAPRGPLQHRLGPNRCAASRSLRGRDPSVVDAKSSAGHGRAGRFQARGAVAEDMR
jgi:hypothetical protein